MIPVPHGQLRPETLTALIEEFITRDGAVQGHAETPLHVRIEAPAATGGRDGSDRLRSAGRNLDDSADRGRAGGAIGEDRSSPVHGLPQHPHGRSQLRLVTSPIHKLADPSALHLGLLSVGLFVPTTNMRKKDIKSAPLSAPYFNTPTTTYMQSHRPIVCGVGCHPPPHHRGRRGCSR
jgi:hypothetical protein